MVYPFFYLKKINLYFLFFIILFIFFRIIFFIDYPFFALHPDSGSHFYLYKQLKNANMPNFYDRSPLYSLVLFFSFFKTEKVLNLMIFQNLLSLFSFILLSNLMISFFKKKYLKIIILIFIFLFLNNPTNVEYDFSYLTESIYTNLLILSFVSMYYAVTKENYIYQILTSILFILVILIKPAGLFMAVIFVLNSIYFFYKNKKKFFYFFFPFLLIYLTICYYNYKTFNIFTFTANEAREITLVNSLYWETDSSYPKYINDAIKNVQKFNLNRVSEEEYNILKNSWNIKKIYPLYLYGHNYYAETQVSKSLNNNRKLLTKWLNRINLDTIKKKPNLFFKHYVIMMVVYYYSVNLPNDFFANLNYRIDDIFIEKKYHKNKQLKEMFFELDSYKINKFQSFLLTEEKKIIYKQTWKKKFIDTIFFVSKKIFNNLIFILIFLLSFIVSIKEFFLQIIKKSKNINILDWLALIMCLSNFGAASIVSLAEYSQVRYSYPLHWQYYILTFYLILKLKHFFLRDKIF